MKMKTLSAIILSLGAVYCSAQIESNGILNAAGGQKVISGNTFEYSIGETVLTTTASSSNLVVTQGLLQPMAIITGIENLNSTVGDLIVYPNPTTDVLYIKPGLNPNTFLEMALYDITGRAVIQKKVLLSSGDEILDIDCSRFASGSYMLEIIGKNQTSQFRNTFKIVKTN